MKNEVELHKYRPPALEEVTRVAALKSPPKVDSEHFPEALDLYLREYRHRTLKPAYHHAAGWVQASVAELVTWLCHDISLELHGRALMLMLYYGTTLQSEEIVALESSHVTSLEGGPLMIELEKSGEGPHQVCPDPEIVPVLTAYLERLPTGVSYLFRKANGDPYTRSDVYALLALLGDDEEYTQFSHFFPIYHERDYGVIPTPLRLNSDTRYTGRGVTIAFIDSGFYPHPDLTKPKNRIKKYVNIAEPRKDDFNEPSEESWHGMQTSVSAAGNGYLSKGLYKGIAPDAEVVLIKVRGRLGIQTRHIIEAIEWVVEHQEEYDIRILNISLSGERPGSYFRSALDQAAEGAIQAGIVVVVSAGNRGGDGGSDVIRPPASAPSVITVGGLNDNNQLNVDSYEMYWSSYGPTVDGILKPEIVAPGIWVAAPLLPHSPLFRESGWIHLIQEASDEEVGGFAKDALAAGVGWPKEMAIWSVDRIRVEIERLMKQHKLVAPFYQHVDGTSFSAPIVCSVIAQMLEANPNLTPARIKQILTNTTDKLYGVPLERQGHGLIHPRKAVKEAVNDLYRSGYRRATSPRVRGRVATFYYLDVEGKARSVALAGEFNGWSADSHPMRWISPGLWTVDHTFERPEWYSYKFVINGTEWIVDPENLDRAPDGYGGYNALVNIMTMGKSKEVVG